LKSGQIQLKVESGQWTVAGRTVSAFHRGGVSTSFKVSGREKRLYGLGNVKVSSTFTKVVGSKGNVLGRPSQWAKLLIVQRAQEDTQKKQISRNLHLGTHAMGGVPNAS